MNYHQPIKFNIKLDPHQYVVQFIVNPPCKTHRENEVFSTCIETWATKKPLLLSMKYCLFNSIMVYWKCLYNWGVFHALYTPNQPWALFSWAHLNFLVMHMMHHPSLTPQNHGGIPRFWHSPRSLPFTGPPRVFSEKNGESLKSFQLTQRKMFCHPHSWANSYNSKTWIPELKGFGRDSLTKPQFGVTGR